MHFKDLVDRMSSEFNMPAADAKKIAKFVLDQFAELIEKKEDFNSPKIRMNIRETSERNTISKITGQPKTIPAQTLGLIKLKK
jgi:nucleoid DNA-binding protein